MIKATYTRPDGSVVIVLGISEGNVQKLKANHPIYFDPAAIHIAAGTPIAAVTLFYGATDAELHDTIRGLIGPDTHIFVVPRGDARPV